MDDRLSTSKPPVHFNERTFNSNMLHDYSVECIEEGRRRRKKARCMYIRNIKLFIPFT